MRMEKAPYRILFLLLLSILTLNTSYALPRVFVFTDINIDAGDPDDRQSLIHLLWYANEVEIEGIVPDRLNAGGYEASMIALDRYEADYKEFEFSAKGYPSTEDLKAKITNNIEESQELFLKAASNTDAPLYVLIWGSMQSFREVLNRHPEVSNNIRVLTIGTGLMLEADIQHIPSGWEKTIPCEQLNWNGSGRNEIYNNPRFSDMWWVEMNWTYNGMFTGDEPAEMFRKLTRYGSMGRHIKEVVTNHSWAQYFRVGDTPSVLYVIDSEHNLDDPATSSWAGRFFKPFPKEKPNYYTDLSDGVEWNYSDPCLTWENHLQVKQIAQGTLEAERPEMYQALQSKLNWLYGKP